MQVFTFDNGDILPRLSLEAQSRRNCNRSLLRLSPPCCGLPISAIPHLDGLPRTNFAYDQLPQYRFRLTIRKLDGCSFQIEVEKTATVAGLKEAVEAVFGHMPRNGPGKISWSHVWGHFCLCYDGWKLLADSEPIKNYGITDGDQLHFDRHVSIRYNLVKRRSKANKLPALEQSVILNIYVEKLQSPEMDGDSDDQEKSLDQHYEDKDTTSYELKLAQLFGGWFSYNSSLGGSGRADGYSFPSPLADGFLVGFISLLRLYSDKKKLDSQRDPLEEV